MKIHPTATEFLKSKNDDLFSRLTEMVEVLDTVRLAMDGLIREISEMGVIFNNPESLLFSLFERADAATLLKLKAMCRAELER